jgi:DNA-binding LacI/PurR family transcriptional regulator
MGASPTIAEIARQSCVSTYTVSLGLRNSPRVAEATRNHVKAVAHQLGYRPNPLVNALMARVRSRRTRITGNVLGFIITRERAMHPGQLDYQARMLRGASARATELGYRVEPIRLTSVNGRGRRLQQVLDARGIHGLIIAPVPDRSFTLRLEWERLACVTVGYSFSEVPVHRVTNNHFRSMRLVIDACRERGWKRPGLLLGSHALEAVDQGFLAGYLTAMYRVNHRIPIPPLLYDDASFNRRTLLRWVKKYRVDAVLSLRHDTRTWLSEAGYTVGNDIGLVMLDCDEEGVEVSGVDQRQVQVGAAAVEMLAQVMQNSEFGVPTLPRIVGLDGRWHEGRTLPLRGAVVASA